MSTLSATKREMKRLLTTILKEDQYVPDYQMFLDVLTGLCERDEEIETIFNETVQQLRDEGFPRADWLPSEFEYVVPQVMFTDKNKKRKVKSERAAKRDMETGKTVYVTMPAEQICFNTLYLHINH